MIFETPWHAQQHATGNVFQAAPAWNTESSRTPYYQAQHSDWNALRNTIAQSESSAWQISNNSLYGYYANVDTADEEPKAEERQAVNWRKDGF